MDLAVGRTETKFSTDDDQKRNAALTLASSGTKAAANGSPHERLSSASF